MIRLLMTLFLAFYSSVAVSAGELSQFRPFAVPAGPGTKEPSLFVTDSDHLLMSWTETSSQGHAVKTATLRNGMWSYPRTIVSSQDLFVNWADFPSVAAFVDGTLIAHWLENTGRSVYAYDFKVAVSRDEGETWSDPVIPHLDGTAAQHGFVTLMPVDREIIAVWLDGRAYEGELVEDGATSGTMQLRATVLSSDGSATSDTAVDFTTCSCCQTAAAVAGEDLLVVYRDRSEDEIRDISLVRFRDGEWFGQRSVHDDNWQFAGCPIDGPAIAAQQDDVVVAWFTAAGDVPAVNVAFSTDAARSFGDAVRIDQGQPVGRVDAVMMPDGSALVSWVEWDGSAEGLFICQVTAEGCFDTRRVAVNSAGGSVNFPQMAATSEGIYLAWTQPLPDGTETIRMLRSER